MASQSLQFFVSFKSDFLKVDVLGTQVSLAIPLTPDMNTLFKPVG